MEENVLLKELLAKHKGEVPVVIDFEAPDEFDENNWLIEYIHGAIASPLCHF